MLRTKYRNIILIVASLALSLASGCQYVVSLDDQDRKRADEYIKQAKAFSTQLDIKEKRLHDDLRVMTESINKLVDQLKEIRRLFEPR